MTAAHSTQLKGCEHCCAQFASVIQTARYCSDKCQRAHYRKTKQHGPFTCGYCLCSFYKKNTHRDAYCGRACYFARKAAVHSEVSALRRIGERARLPAMLERKRVWIAVALEVKALHRIAAGVVLRQRDCPHCGIRFLRSRAWQRCCSQECGDAARIDTRRLYMHSDAGRSVVRAAKSRRKAIMRGSNGADRIDPIKVFERDKWRCHLCGIKTTKSLRGTIQAKAPELEHIVSLADGGSHTWGNVACSCRQCNQTKGSASFGQLGLGFAA